MSDEHLTEIEEENAAFAGDIEAFLLGDAESLNKNKLVYPGDRFIAAKMPFEVRMVTDEELKDWRKSCNRTVRNNGKVENVFNAARFQDLVITNCCVSPCFKSADFIKRVADNEEKLAKKEKRAPRKVVTPEDAVACVLKVGEKDLLVGDITKHSGFERTLDEEKAAIKNF